MPGDPKPPTQSDPQWVTVTVMFHTANISFTIHAEASRAQWHLQETFMWFLQQLRLGIPK